MDIIQTFLILFSSHLNSRIDFLASFPFLLPLIILRHNVHLTWKNYQDSERIGYKFEQAKAEKKKSQAFQY